MRKTIAYLRARASEHSTWIAIGAGIAVASALPWPWSVVSAVVGVIAALVPDPPKAAG